MSPLSEVTRARRLLEFAHGRLASALLERDALVLELHEVHGLSLREIGGIIGYSHAGVAKIVERARRNGA